MIVRTRPILFAAVFALGSLSAEARLGNLERHAVPRVAALRTGMVNRLSNIQFWQTNYGELFLDISVPDGKAGTFWPRGSGFSYILGGGFWLGAVKNGIHHVLVSYNPSDGRSWLQPGSVASAQAFYDSVRAATGFAYYPPQTDARYASRFPVYMSTDYDRFTGKPLDPRSPLPRWPLWDTDPDSTHLVGENHYFGTYVEDLARRNTSVYPVHFFRRIGTRFDATRGITVPDTQWVHKGGPAFVSEEDLYTICNDLDTLYYVQKSPGRFYPLRVDVERRIYSWASDTNKDYIFIVYNITNRSNAALDSCWLAPVLDPDIGVASNDENGFYSTAPSLNLALQWSDQEGGVPGAHDSVAYPGVLGLDFLESPTLYRPGEAPDSLVGTIKPGVHPNSEQLGLGTFLRWTIGGARPDPTTDDGRYAFLSAQVRDTAPDPSQWADKRMLMATGPFRLLAGQSAQVAVGLMIARDSLAGDSDLDASRRACVALDKRAQQVYDSSFHAPATRSPAVGPLAPTLLLTPGDHRMLVQWDSIAEYSYDPYSAGLDFLGYRLYRRAAGTTSRILLAEWALSDLDSASYHALAAQVPPDTASPTIRQAFYDRIYRVMDSLTGHHRYLDRGDDNHDGTVTDSERLVNGEWYQYTVEAFDQGDPAKRIASAVSHGGAVGRPAFPAMRGDSSSRSIPMTDSLGGVSDITWWIQNQAIVNQLLDGDTISTTFETYAEDIPFAFGAYGEILHYADTRGRIAIADTLSGSAWPVLFSHPYAGTELPIVDSTLLDSTRYGDDRLRRDVLSFTGTLSSMDTARTAGQVLLNAITQTMCYRFLAPVQRISYVDPNSGSPAAGWAPQPYQLDTISGTGLAIHGPDSVAFYWDNSGYLRFDSLADRGACDYLVTFGEDGGGVERDTLWDQSVYDIPYFSVSVRAEQRYTVHGRFGSDSVVVVRYLLSPADTLLAGQSIGPARWAMQPVVWKVTPTILPTGTSRYRSFLGLALSRHGVRNRYYLTARKDTVTLQFANRLQVGGNVFYLDSAFNGVTRFTHDTMPGICLHPSRNDLWLDDTVCIRYTGGVLGLPAPGATQGTAFLASPLDVDEHLLLPDNPLARVRCWPNPIIAGRQRLVLDGLPDRCSLTLSTITGERLMAVAHGGGSAQTFDLAAAGVPATQLLFLTIQSPGGATRTLRLVVFAPRP